MTRLSAEILRSRTEKAKQARLAELDLLRRLRRFNGNYAIGAAGFWLKLWTRTRSVLRGTHRKVAA